MPREVTDKEAILSALKSHELTSELFIEVNGKLKSQGDLDVIVEGKVNAAGKRVGPYVRLLTYESGEVLQNTILPLLKPFFSGDYTTTRCEIRFAEEFD